MPHPKGGYKNANGQRIPGVTTIIGRFKDSGGLLWWAFEQGKSAERGEISSLYDKRDEAADAGTLAHAMVEAHINGEVLPVLPADDIGKQAQQGFENYLRWADDNKIQIIKQEMELVSEKYQFGGCPDAIGLDSRGKLTLLDWKTSASGPYVDWLAQLAAYEILWNENNIDKPITGGFHLLKFSKENADFSHFFWHELEEAKEYFLLLLNAHRIDKQLKKRI